MGGGASLRELQRFLEKHDTDKTYAGLRRLGYDDGTAVWTVLIAADSAEHAAGLLDRAIAGA